MSTHYTIKNPSAKSVLGIYVEEPIGMDHPLFMVRFQTKVDARFQCEGNIPICDAIASTVKRMQFLFGDDIPVELVASTVSLVYAEVEAQRNE